MEKFFAEIVPEIVHIPDPQTEITRIKNYLQKIVPSPAGKSFLDISCRQGYAVIAAKELGMRARGIDPHEFFIEFAKDKYDANLFEHISVQEYAARGEKADFVYSIESFCEQSDPEGYYFDAPASLALSLEMNYGVVALVGVNCIEVRKQNAMHDEFTTVSD